MTGRHTLTETERAARRRLGGMSLDFAAAAALSHLHRAANAVRNHFEQQVLRDAGLTWTGFVVLWVIWIWEDIETRHVAAEAGIAKGTLTGVVKTLRTRGLVERAGHPEDGRLVRLRLTAAGDNLMQTLFPAFNAEETFVLAGLAPERVAHLTETLGHVVNHLDADGAARRAARAPGGGAGLPA